MFTMEVTNDMPNTIEYGCNLCGLSFADHNNDPNAPCPTITVQLEAVDGLDTDDAIAQAERLSLVVEQLPPVNHWPELRLTGPANTVFDLTYHWGYDRDELEVIKG